MLKPQRRRLIVSSKVSRFIYASRNSRVRDPPGGSGPFRPLRIPPSHASRAQRASGSIGATLRPCCEQTCEQVHKFTRLFTARSRSRPDTQTDVTSVRKGRSLMRNEPGIAASRPPQPGWRPGPRQASDAAHKHETRCHQRQRRRYCRYCRSRCERSQRRHWRRCCLCCRCCGCFCRRCRCSRCRRHCLRLTPRWAWHSLWVSICAPETTAELSALAGAGEGMQGAPVERQHPRQGRQRAHHVQSCLG